MRKGSCQVVRLVQVVELVKLYLIIDTWYFEESLNQLERLERVAELVRLHRIEEGSKSTGTNHHAIGLHAIREPFDFEFCGFEWN